MPTPRPSPDPAPKPNSSRPTSTRKPRTAKPNPADYPSYVRPKSVNPLIKKALHPLNEKGMILKRLGLTEEDVKDAPDVTPAVKEALGSVREAISLLRGDDAPDSRRFITKFDSLSPHDQKKVVLEHVIIAAGLTTRRFMELLAGASFDHSATVGKIFVTQSQLKVLKSTVKAATSGKGDVKAMEIFHKITGALPTPKPSNFIINPQFNSTPRAEESAEPKTPLQAMDAFLLEIDDVRKPKQLSAPVEPEIPVEMPDNAPEIEYMPLGEIL